MVKQRIKVFFICIIMVAVCMVATADAQELVTNGGFETGDFTGWKRVQQGIGFFYTLAAGDPLPLSAPTYTQFLPPPVGTYAAVVDTYSPTSAILYQDITIPAGNTASFSAIVYLKNYNAVAPFYILGADLHNNTPNQQMRVDIMDPATDIFDNGPVLMNLFQTNVGDTVEFGYTTLTANLTPYAGSTIRIRIAQVNTNWFFNGCVDAVSVVATAAVVVPVPTLSEWGMIILATLMALVAIIPLNRKRKS